MTVILICYDALILVWLMDLVEMKVTVKNTIWKQVIRVTLPEQRQWQNCSRIEQCLLASATKWSVGKVVANWATACTKIRAKIHKMEAKVRQAKNISGKGSCQGLRVQTVLKGTATRGLKIYDKKKLLGTSFQLLDIFPVQAFYRAKKRIRSSLFSPL